MSLLESLTPEQRAAARKQVTDALWRQGNLRYLFDDAQLKIYDTVNSAQGRRHCALCSRRLGKTFLFWAIACETAIRKPGAQILYLAPLASDAYKIATDTSSKVMADCPKDLRPYFAKQEKEFHWPNGSLIRLSGTNGDHAKNIRGQTYDMVILDECGFMDDFKQVLNDIVEPTTLTTKGRILLSTTPPVSTGHDFVNVHEFYARKGWVSKFTILDADQTRIERQEIWEAFERAGEAPEEIDAILDGRIPPKTTSVQREYFCEFVTDASSAVVKEYTEAARKEIIRVVERPPYFDCYISMDPGMRDRTGILFGYWDFVANKLVIEDEALLDGPGTAEIAKVVKEKSETLWGNKEPYRYLDNDLRLVSDLWTLHGQLWNPVRKEDRLGAVNLMRHDVQTRTLVIHPRCVNLDRQLKNATWNRKATDFERGGEGSIDGHFDLCAALYYMCRSVNRHRNPYPENWNFAFRGVPQAGQYVPRAQRPRAKLGLHSDTPIGRKLAGRGKY